MSKRKVDHADDGATATEQSTAKQLAPALWEEIQGAPAPLRAFQAKGSDVSKKTQRLPIEVGVAFEAVNSAIQEGLKSIPQREILFKEGIGTYYLGKLFTKGATYIFTAEDKFAGIVCFENAKLQFMFVQRTAACGVKGRDPAGHNCPLAKRQSKEQIY